MKIKELLTTSLLLSSIHLSASESIKQLRLDSESKALQNAQFVQSFQKLQKGAVTFATVGADSCDYTTVQDAVDSGVDEVRIATNSNYNENVFLTNISIKLRGGYSSCSAANNDNQSTAKSHIIGVPNASQPVIAITGHEQRNRVTLENLDISGGTGTNFLKGGGISTLDSDASVAIVNSDIHDNNGNQGGGIGIFGDSANANTDFLLVDTIISNNFADQLGGGLYCKGDKSSVLVVGNSGISLNMVDTSNNKLIDSKGSFPLGNGGGIYITTSCKFTMYSGTKTSQQGVNQDLRGIAFNQAEHYGGGVYMSIGGDVELNGHQFCFNLGSEVCLGDNINPININNNTAEYGGGANIVGASSKLKIYAALVANNQVDFIGGGVDIISSTNNFVTAQLYPSCWDKNRCNSYQNNTAKLRGGAIRFTNGTTSIYHTKFIGNRADKGTVFTLSDNVNLTSEGCVYSHNGDYGNDGFLDLGVINSFGNSTQFTSLHDSYVDNHTNSAIFVIDTALEVNSGIISEDSNLAIIEVPFDYSSSANFNCIIASESDSFGFYNNVNVTDITVADPQFIDRANGDYHINAATSPAVDRCGNAFAQHTDMDHQNRGWNDPSVTNFGGVAFNSYDAGADETYGNDIIFKNEFELD